MIHIATILLLLALCGCAAPQPKPVASLLPPPVPAVKRSAVSSKPQIAPKPPLSTGVRFIYPADATNYTWSLQCSADLYHWRTLVGDMSGYPAGSYEVRATNPQQFYRMKGDRNPQP